MQIDKIYFDMDGVLADFDRGVREFCGMEPPPQEEGWKPGMDLPMWEKIREVEHFYDRLQICPGSQEMFDTIYGKYGDRCEILTGVPKPDKGIKDAGEDKIRWIRRLFSDKVKVNVVLREEKPNYCTGKGCILIDDLKMNIQAWEEMGGIGIRFVSAEDTLKRLAEIEERVTW